MNQSNINLIGGAGTLENIWRRIKELHLVVGVERLWSEVSSASSEELESLCMSVSRNPDASNSFSDLKDLITTVDSHRSSVLSSLWMRLVALGVEFLQSNCSYSTEDTDDEFERGEVKVVQNLVFAKKNCGKYFFHYF